MRNFVADPGSIAEIGRAIKEQRTDPVALVERYLQRIDAVEEQVCGWCLLDREGTLNRARALRQEAQNGRLRGPLHGIPVAIKDVIDVAGLPTKAGSATRAKIAPATIDAHIVTRLQVAGAIVLGKAHTTEFAYFDGPPPTRNPHHLDHTPGGSSAGPAAVVAAGMVPLSLGTQTAGSVSRPAAYCGIAAFKPSTLAWSSAGVVPFAPSFDTVGVFGYRLDDALAAAKVLMPAYLRRSAPPTSSLSLAAVEDPVLSAASTHVSASVSHAADQLANAGFRVERFVSPVPFVEVGAWHKTIVEYEVAHAHPHLDQFAEVSVGLRDAVARGKAISDLTYLDACGALAEARERFWATAARFDSLVFPAAPDIAPKGMKTGDPRFIVPFTAFGGPIVSIPIGLGVNNLPLGLMLIGAPGVDATMVDIAPRIAQYIQLPR
jgi:aspartyl-tRNA(Asn)/glutamyl-tRNA(Gln) amidotransferase subunit A